MLTQPPERVALYAPSMRGGGAERVMLNLANDFADRGLDVDLVLVSAEGPYLKNVSPQVRLIDLKASRSLESFPGLMRYLWRERPAALLATIGQNQPARPSSEAASRRERACCGEGSLMCLLKLRPLCWAGHISV